MTKKQGWTVWVVGTWIVAGLATGSLRAEETAKAASRPPTLEERLQSLEEAHQVLQRQYEVDKEEAANKAKERPVLVAGKDGFGWKSPDGAFQIKFWGDAQVDGRFFLNDANDAAKSWNDTFLLRRFRPSVDVTMNGRTDLRVQPNFGGNGARLDDAYIDHRFTPGVKLRFGQFKPPVGLENLQGSARITFIERALPTNLVPVFDHGVQLSGDLWGARVNYAAALTNGVADGGSPTADDTSDRKDVGGRLWLSPFKTSARPALSELGFGIAAVSGKRTGNSSASAFSSNLGSVKSDGQQTIFSYTSNRAYAKGWNTRWSPQLTWYPGRLGVLAEYVASTSRVASTATAVTDRLTNRAWQVAVNYVLTGEKASYKGVTPRHVFNPAKGEWGAWEVAARYAQFNADDAAFLNAAGAASSVSAARSWTGALNWHLSGNTRVSTNVASTSFDGGASGAGRRPTERVILTRVQFSY